MAPRCIPVRCVVVPASTSSRAMGNEIGLRVLQRPIAFAKTRKGKDVTAVEVATSDSENHGDDQSGVQISESAISGAQRVAKAPSNDFPLITLAEAVLAIAYPNSK